MAALPLPQGTEPTLLLESGNAYQRAIQYQQLRRDQFGAAAPPGFIVSKAQGEVCWLAGRAGQGRAVEGPVWRSGTPWLHRGLSAGRGELTVLDRAGCGCGGCLMLL